MVPTSRLAPRLTARYSTRTVCAGGLALVAAGLAIIAQSGTHTPYGLMAGGLIVLGVGMGAAMTAGDERDHRSAATRPAGRRLGAQRPLARGRRRDRDRGDRQHPHIRLQQPREPHRTSSRVAAEVKASYAAASRLGPEVSVRAHTAFVTAMHVALLTGAGAALLAALATVVLLNHRPHTRSAAEPDRPTLTDTVVRA